MTKEEGTVTSAMDGMTESDSQVDSQPPSHPQDHHFVELLLAGNNKAWNDFYGRIRPRIESYIRRKYPDTFTDVAVEEISDGMTKRLTDNDYKALRAYRGECSFSVYVTRATDWEIRDWLRKQADQLLAGPMIPLDEEGAEQPATVVPVSPPPDDEVETPEALKYLTNDLRWAFLLRYYDYFGFPLEEIRLFARTKNVPIHSVTSRLVRYLDPRGDDVLGPQREKQGALRNTLEKICYEIYKLNLKEQKLFFAEVELLSSSTKATSSRTEKLASVKADRVKFEKRRDALLKDQQRFAVTTPYDIIARILGEDSASTIRSRVFLAKKQLTTLLAAKGNKTIDPDASSKG